MSARLRRSILYSVPVLYLALGLAHPTENPKVGTDTTLWIALHLAQLALIPGLAVVLWLLVNGISGRSATATRALLAPFLVVYTTLDAILGLAWGIVARRAGQLDPTDQAAAQRLLDNLLRPDTGGYLLYFGAGALWLGVALATIHARRTITPRVAQALMGAGALAFALGHARPTGPVGMALFLAGIVWSEHHPEPHQPTDRNRTPRRAP